MKYSWKWRKRDLLENFVSFYLYTTVTNGKKILFLDSILVKTWIEIFLSNKTFLLLITVIFDSNFIRTTIF